MTTSITTAAISIHSISNFVCDVYFCKDTTFREKNILFEKKLSWVIKLFTIMLHHKSVNSDENII